eukprot:COSAG02_NODE_43834_length_369_cov_0.860294_1_plen_98_part_10
MPGAIVTKRGRNESKGQSISSMNVQRPESCIDSNQAGNESTLVKDDKSYLIDSSVLKERLYLHDGYYTSHGDTFKDVCSAIGIDKAQWRMRRRCAAPA